MDFDKLAKANEIKAKIDSAEGFVGHLIQSTRNGKSGTIRVESDVYKSGEMRIDAHVVEVLAVGVHALIKCWKEDFAKL